MKKSPIKPTALILCVLILITAFSSTSCISLFLPDVGDSIFDSPIFNLPSSTTDKNHASSPNFSDESTPPSPDESVNNPFTDTPEDSDPPSPPITDVSLAAAEGLRSAVSVICLFNGGSASSAGSGVIYKLDAQSGSALIITNYHVVYNSSSKTANRISDDISVLLFGLEYEDYAIPATYVGGSQNYDIAILYVKNSEHLKTAAKNGSAKAIKITNSDYVAAGQTAIAIGNPEADGISVTMGIVSVDSEQITMTSVNGLSTVDMRVIRIDTAINSGNSGGGLFNTNGEMIGIVNAKIKSSDVENIGYAIPSNIVRAIADNIIDYCFGKNCETAMRALMGITVTIDSISTSYNEELGMIVVNQKIRVYEVSNGSIAYGVFKPDDIILGLSINDRTVTITRQHHLIDAMLDVRVGDRVKATVLRNGKETTVTLTITEDCLVAY